MKNSDGATRKTETCTACDGWGYVEDEYGDYPLTICPECGGTGEKGKEK